MKNARNTMCCVRAPLTCRLSEPRLSPVFVQDRICKERQPDLHETVVAPEPVPCEAVKDRSHVRSLPQTRSLHSSVRSPVGRPLTRASDRKCHMGSGGGRLSTSMIDFRIDHVAYVENLKPFEGSKLSVAFMSPTLPSWIKSRRLIPRSL